MIRPASIFSLFYFLFIVQLYGERLRDWIFYEKSPKIAVLAVYSDRANYEKLRESMQIYRDESYLKRFEETFRIKAIGTKEFLHDFPDLEERSSGRKTAFYFFSDDGMLLLMELYSPHELPDYGLYLRYEEAQKEYQAYLAGETPKRGPLYWPRRAFLSGNYAQARTLLEQVAPSRLSKKERAAYYTLFTMLHRREQESRSQRD